jgi:predicted ester cyclase
VGSNDMVSEGDKVVVYYTMEGTHQGEFMGLAPTGARVAVEGFDLIRVTDEICTEHWGVFDNGSLAQQLGAGAPG